MNDWGDYPRPRGANRHGLPPDIVQRAVDRVTSPQGIDWALYMEARAQIHEHRARAYMECAHWLGVLAGKGNPLGRRARFHLRECVKHVRRWVRASYAVARLEERLEERWGPGWRDRPHGPNIQVHLSPPGNP
jgi:hypothetical protein